MASDDVFKLGANADDIVSEVERSVRIFAKLDEAMRNTTGGTVLFNASSRTAEATLRGLTDAGDKVRATFVENEKGTRLARLSFDLVAKSVDSATDSVKAFANAQREANAILREEEARLKGVSDALERARKTRAAIQNAQNADFQNRVRDQLQANQGAQANRAAIFGSLQAGDLARQDAQLANIQRAITYRQQLTSAIQAEKRAEEQKNEQLAREEAITQRIRSRNAAAFGASLGGGNLSFTSLGRAVNLPNAGVGANFALGLGVGAAASAADSLVGTFTAQKDSAIEFNKQLGLINTITKDGTSSTQQWADALRGLSREFNIDEVQVAEGAYQALSNQIIKGSKDTQFLNDALTLAKTTNSGAVESVNALSAVMNSYGRQAGSSAEITDQLFRAVDLGNFKLSEIGTSLGRVTSLAAPLGVSFREVLASLETTTVKGVKADEALSSLSNLYAELLKPSKELTASLQRLGLATSEQGIATLGYSGFLKAVIADATKFGTTTSELFPTVRGLRDVLLEASDGFELYNKNLDGTTKSSGAAKEALEKVRAAAGEETKRAFNDLKESASSVWDDFLTRSDRAAKRLLEIRQGIKDAEAERAAALEKGERDHPERAEQRAENLRRARQFRAERGIADPDADHEQAVARTNRIIDDAAAQVQAYIKTHVPAAKAAEEDLHQTRLKKIAELRAAQNKSRTEESALVAATSKEFLENIDKRTTALKESLAKQRDLGGGDALATALKLASPEQAKKLTEERVQQLKQIAQDDLTDSAKLHGKDFVLDKGLEDAKKAADEIVKLKTEARDAAIGRVKPEDRAQALAAVTSGSFGSLTGLGPAGGDVQKAQEELDQAKLERVEIEERSLKILKEKGEELKKQREEAILDNKRFSDSEALNNAGKALRAAGIPDSVTSGLFGGSAAIDAQRLAISGPASRDSSPVRTTQQFFASILRGVPGAENAQAALAAASGLQGGTAGFSLQTDRQRSDSASEAARKLGGFIGPSRTDKDVFIVEEHHNAILKDQEAITTHREETDKSVRSLLGYTNAITNATIELEKFRFKTAAAGGRLPAGFDTSLPENSFTNKPRLGFEEGGVVPGTYHPSNPDSVAAMLTPGERVLTREQNRDFWPLIESSMQGKMRGYNGGGQVIHMGGLNITVKGGSTSQQTVGEIGRGLQRAIRRGTLKF